ncbi:hypothetical protein LCGC14_2567980 [marine sediment metagenome]|uniref:GST N-terminal domain-containing protein n=1 Tax=marine sediment metagenome TaxID=412755 RepID=A0A0F9CU77_9ZZZZ
MKLHGYHKSSATLRVVIVLELKKLDYEVIAINLKKDEQGNMLVPILEDKDKIITQSLSIIEYLEKNYKSGKLRVIFYLLGLDITFLILSEINEY